MFQEKLCFMLELYKKSANPLMKKSFVLVSNGSQGECKIFDGSTVKLLRITHCEKVLFISIYSNAWFVNISIIPTHGTESKSFSKVH